MDKANRFNFFRAVNYLFFGIVCVVMIYPFWHLIIGSLMSQTEYIASVIMLLPKDITFAAYQDLIETGTIWRPLYNTVWITLVGTVSSMVVTTLFAYGMSKRFMGSKVIMSLIIITMFVSGGIVPLYVLLNSMKLINNMAVYVLPSLINTFYFIIMRTSFLSFPAELEEAALIDGCGVLATLLRIVIPLSLPVLATVSLFYAVNYWNTLFPSIMFVTDQRKKSLYNYIYTIISDSEGSFTVGKPMATYAVKFANITVAMLPIMLVYPFLQKYYVKGAMIGGIKG